MSEKDNFCSTALKSATDLINTACSQVRNDNIEGANISLLVSIAQNTALIADRLTDILLELRRGGLGDE